MCFLLLGCYLVGLFLVSLVVVYFMMVFFFVFISYCRQNGEVRRCFYSRPVLYYRKLKVAIVV